ncbi:allantoate permease [Talaromyces proteolyticus]|uniref:Allantoate permease n=1 Tax=Talaromyces proteolyticus TaxID=1131652 RepID=A0AAD4KXU9_9EURO|nr:allantoate permease [Talaromyces proteolyticus]KAH8703556.1 allantoate permease [Talaromyces proteolyticus]
MTRRRRSSGSSNISETERLLPSEEPRITDTSIDEPESRNPLSERRDSSISEEFTKQESYEKNPFLDPDVAEHWRRTYEESKYECRHLFDPNLTWSEEEEKRLIRLIDWNVCLWSCVMFLSLQVDRSNLGQAVSDTFLQDLGLNTNDFNWGNAIFRLSFILAELPSQFISKKIGPDRWIPTQITLWSIVAISQCALTGRWSFFVTRALLGALEGGFIPDIILWLSYFYTSTELPIRLSIFWTTLPATVTITSLLAFAIFHLSGVNGWAGWQWLFLIEGLFTLAIGITSYAMMPASAVQTKSFLRPNGWFKSSREVAIVVNRVLRDDPSKGDMNNRQPITLSQLWSAITDYHLWPLYIIGLVAFIPQTPPSIYITLILRSVGFSKFVTSLLTILPSLLYAFNLLLITYASEWLNNRSLVAIIQPMWALPFLIALRFWSGLIENAWGTFALVTVIVGGPNCHAIIVAWTSKNSNSVGARTVSSALYNMAVQAGDIIALFMYRDDDKPLYHRGNTELLMVNILVVFIFIGTKVYYTYENRRRDRIWNNMKEEEQKDYIRNSKAQGSKRLEFRFAS